MNRLLACVQDNQQNEELLIAKGVGLCDVDKKLVDDGGVSITPIEAISFLDLQVGLRVHVFYQLMLEA